MEEAVQAYRINTVSWKVTGTVTESVSRIEEFEIVDSSVADETIC